MKQYVNIPYNHAGQVLDIFLPEQPFRKLFLFFHGGGLTGGTKDFEPFMGWLTEHGIAVISASYRIYPEARFPDYIEDAADAVRWVRDNLPDKELYVGGSSAGGYLSMMLCFDGSYLACRGISASDIHGYIHNAGQPTTHFSILQERGLDPRRILIDEAAPLYYIGMEHSYPPMLFLVAEEDIPGRLEQTKLIIATLRHFGCENSVPLKILPGYHVAYDNAFDAEGNSIFGKLILEFIGNT